MTRVLITGASGFIGRHCLALLRGGACEVHAVNRSGTAIGGGDVRWHAADLRDPAQATGLIERIRPTHLLHLAWEATPRVYNHSPDNFRWLEAGLAMVRAFGEQGGSRFVGAGTSAEYAGGHARCYEDETPIRPVSIYGKCKAGCWLGIEALAQHYRFSAAWGRVFLPYGPGDAAARLIPSVLSALREGRPVETTQGRQRRDFIYAPDAAALLVALLRSPAAGAFNVGTGRGTAIREAVEYLARQVGGLALVRFGALAPMQGEPPELVADMGKVATALGWTAPTSIEAGLDRLLARQDEPAIARAAANE